MFKDNERLFSPAFQEALTSNQTVSAQLGNMINRLRVNHNPIIEAKERLSDVVNRLNSMEGLSLQMAEMVKSLNDIASQFLVDFTAATKKANRLSMTAIFISTIAFVVTALSMIISELRAIQDQADTVRTISAITSLIEANAEVQHESMVQIESELSSANAAAMKSYDQLSIAIENLTEALRIQNEPPISSESVWESVSPK